MRDESGAIELNGVDAQMDEHRHVVGGNDERMRMQSRNPSGSGATSLGHWATAESASSSSESFSEDGNRRLMS